MEQHFAVIGKPIAHSLSPVMHQAGYLAIGLNAVYHRFEVHEAELGAAVQGLKALGFSGWNVTLPYKEKIIEYIDELTLEASQAGAVNTVKVAGPRLIGHNTDGPGFVRSIESFLKGGRRRKAVILGAGGAAKGIALALANQGMQLHILNRTLDKAVSLAEMLNRAGAPVTAGPLARGAWLEDVDLLVQTTAAGLHGEDYPFSLEGIRPQTLVVDIIFNPSATNFLRQAARLGCTTLNGIGMLVHQGALAWEFWLDRPAPIAAMRQALEDVLRQPAESGTAGSEV